MSWEVFEAEVKRRGCLAREHSNDKAVLRDNLHTTDELYILLLEKSEGAFDALKFDEQRKGGIKVEMIDKEFWDKADTMSLCDYCKTVTMRLPRMMVCASCKCRHYCSKECQKKHWKAGHKGVCAAEFARGKESQTTRLCQKIMALLSLDGPVLNSWSGRFNQHLLRFGVRGGIYIPVCDSVELSFIPMPLDVVDILSPVGCQFSYGNAIEACADNLTAMLLIPTKKPTPGQNTGVYENTAVHAFPCTSNVKKYTKSKSKQ